MDMSGPYQPTARSLSTQISGSKQVIADCLRRSDYPAALQELRRTFSLVDHSLSYQESERLDDLLKTFLFKVLPDHALLGYEAVQLYFGVASNLAKPYSLLPKRTLLDLLKALTVIPATKGSGNSAIQLSSIGASYRILQRLVTGNGVRARQITPLFEADWNRVLGAFCRQGRMDRAHQLVTLHKKQQNPTISAVTFSILLQGQGQQRQFSQVLGVWDDALDYGIMPDVIMVNTLLNAFIDCEKIEEARCLFNEVVNGSVGNYFRDLAPPSPNARTYNIMLKGLAGAGAYQEATVLGDDMKARGLWDFVTTNTLVHAAVVTENYNAAESVLESHTLAIDDTRRRHPNVDAYTELLDAYGKTNQLDKAIATLQVMKQRNVESTEVTYTCLVAGFGRHGKADEALQTVDFMISNGVRPSCVVYNALISALVEVVPKGDDILPEHFDARVDKSLIVLKSMVQSGVRPNAVTVWTLVSALGRCSTPRVEAAKMLVHQLTSQSFIDSGDSQVVAALIQTCSAGNDLPGAVTAFKTLPSPDVISVNAFLDASCRCGKDKLAFQTFDHYFRNGRLRPDVITYTILMTSMLRKESTGALTNAYSWYRDMKSKSHVAADTTLIDTILKSLVRVSRSRTLTKTEVLFVAEVMRDADLLEWEDGKLERRKKVIRGVLGDRLRSVLRRDDNLSRALAPEDDELFRRKGWNQVDSGFRLWGSLGKDTDESSDQFLKSKGWNDVDSGFRIL